MSQPPPINAPANYSMPPAPRKGNAAAVTSLILGVLGCVPWVTGLLAVILGIVGLRKTKDPMVGGKGMAIAGLVLGLLSLFLWTAFGGGIWAFVAGTGPIRDAGRQFVVDLAAGNTTQAHARCTSDITLQDCEEFSKVLRDMGSLQDTSVFGTQASDVNGMKTAAVAGVVELSKGKKTFNLAMIKQNDQWKIQGAQFTTVGK